jgi:Na+-translocating ferredoxin:NAD+ oxidoreductase RnfD subunit
VTNDGEVVYGLGLIGALVWYLQQASGAGEHVVAVLKAIVWPAFLVYDALEALHR